VTGTDRERSEFPAPSPLSLQVGWSPSYVAEDEPHPQEVGGRNIHSIEQGYWELYVIVCGKFTLIISQTTSNIIIVLLALIKNM
jgi:hypothetical protein